MKNKTFILLSAIAAIASVSANATEIEKDPRTGLGVHVGVVKTYGDYLDTADSTTGFKFGADYTFDNGLFLGFDYVPNAVEDSEYIRLFGQPVSANVESSMATIYAGYQDLSGWRSGIGITQLKVDVAATTTYSSGYGYSITGSETGLGFTPMIGYRFDNNVTLDASITIGEISNIQIVSPSINLGYKF